MCSFVGQQPLSQSSAKIVRQVHGKSSFISHQAVYLCFSCFSNTSQLNQLISYSGFQMSVLKPKPKCKLLWPITTDVNNSGNQSEFKANTCTRRQARENACDQVTIGFGFVSHWLRKRRDIFLDQSQSAVKANAHHFPLHAVLVVLVAKSSNSKTEFGMVPEGSFSKKSVRVEVYKTDGRASRNLLLTDQFQNFFDKPSPKFHRKFMALYFPFNPRLNRSNCIFFKKTQNDLATMETTFKVYSLNVHVGCSCLPYECLQMRTECGSIPS